MSLGSPQVIAGLVCQELCLARMLQARRCSAGVLKDRKKEGVKGGSRNRMAEWGGGTKHSSNCTRPREAAQRRGWENGERCSPGLMYKLKR